MEENKELEKPHKRRVRYKGTHPRKFEEKYKELQPEKYKDTIEKVIRKGSTPAGMHISICVQEILDFLQIQPGQKGLDCTLGYGGHTRKMLECLQGEGHIYGLDVDPIEIVKTTDRLRKAGYGEDILTIIQQNFRNIDLVAEEHGLFDFVLADLGVSSMQIDNPERGFSYKVEGPLDLRLNPDKGISAAERLRELTRDEIEGMLRENADEPYAEQIAKEIMKTFRQGEQIDTTGQLKEVIERALVFLPDDKEKKDTIKKTCQRTFQALRIDVNSEFEVLEEFLEKLPHILAPGGRVAILTFHSGVLAALAYLPGHLVPGISVYPSRRQPGLHTPAVFQPVGGMGRHGHLARGQLEFPALGALFCGSADFGEGLPAQAAGQAASPAAASVYPVSGGGELGHLCRGGLLPAGRLPEGHVRSGRGRTDGCGGMVLLTLLPACTADFRRSLHPPGRPALEASAGAVHASFAARAPAGGTGLFHRLSGGRHV